MARRPKTAKNWVGVVPMEEYALFDGVNWSTLKAMRDSPLHYEHRTRVSQDQTAAMNKGGAGHIGILEPKRFKRDVVVYEKRRAGNEWELFAAENAGKIILKPDEYEQCLGMQRAVRKSKVASKYFDKDGVAELSMTWVDPESGLRCKGRMDWLNPSTGRPIVDVKTAVSASGRIFAQQAARLGYHTQLAHYTRGYQLATGAAEQRAVVIVVVESEPPYDVAVFTLDEDVMYAAHEEVKELLAKVAACKESKKWPGRYETEQALVLPAWCFPDERDVSEMLTFNNQNGE